MNQSVQTAMKSKRWVLPLLFGTVSLSAAAFGWHAWQQSHHQSTFADITDVPTGVFSYTGEDAWTEIRTLSDGALRSSRPEFNLNYRRPSSISGIEPTADRPTPPEPNDKALKTPLELLLKDRAAFIQTSKPLTPEDRRFAQQQQAKLKETPIALDAIAIAVHPSLNITGLTIDQLKKIYSGAIANWNEVGGPNLKITPYRTPDDFDIIANTKPITLANTKTETFPTTTQALRKLSDNPSAIVYGSASLIVRQCSIKPLSLGRTAETFVSPYQEPFIPLSRCPKQRNRLNAAAFQTGEYPLLRYLSIVTKDSDPVSRQVGDAYTQLMMTTEGQTIVEKAGFVKLKR